MHGSWRDGTNYAPFAALPTAGTDVVGVGLLGLRYRTNPDLSILVPLDAPSLLFFAREVLLWAAHLVTC